MYVIAQGTAELEKNVKELASVIEGQNTSDVAQLSGLVAELATRLDSLKTEIKALENMADARPAQAAEDAVQHPMDAVFTLQLLHTSDMDSTTGALTNVETFSAPGTEQDALSEYLAHFHSENPFDQPETSPLEDRRSQNLGVPGKRDTVFGP